ncbi:MAG: hypothetical protein GY869_29135, partial [Planctomycetes bacterium]|nr:hypothetical protein [Planctomycetota bacterium]
MGLFDFFKNLFDGGKTEYGAADQLSDEYSMSKRPSVSQKKSLFSKFNLQELSRRLEISSEKLNDINPVYHEYKIPKRSGGFRLIAAPAPDLKNVQKTILHRLLNKLSVHPHATGFQKGHSIVTNANVHKGAEVIVKMDIKDFFPSTSAPRI